MADMESLDTDVPDLMASQTNPPIAHSKPTGGQSPFGHLKTAKPIMGPPAKVPKSPIRLGAVQSVVMGKIVKKSLLGEKAKVLYV